MSTQARKLVIGTRGSKLALWQANHVATLLREAEPGLEVKIEVVKTKGDRIQDVALSKIGDRGLFTKDIEQALIEGRIDLCVHSMKDVPTYFPEGLCLTAILKRADVRDVLVAAPGTTLENLPAGSKLGTGSLRRRAQLMALRPDLEFCELRGNLDTRIGKVTSGELNAAVLAAAGIERMEWTDRIAQYIPHQTITPAVGQGAIGIEIREDDDFVRSLCQKLNDPETWICVSAERYILSALEGGCQVPIGSYARIEADEQGKPRFVIDALVASLDGSKICRSTQSGEPGSWEEIAKQAHEDLLGQGACQILAEIRGY